MSTKKYRIRLTTDEQQELNALVSQLRLGLRRTNRLSPCGVAPGVSPR